VSEYRGFGVDEGQRFTSIGTIYVPLYADTPRRLRAVTFLPVPTPTPRLSHTPIRFCPQPFRRLNADMARSVSLLTAFSLRSWRLSMVDLPRPTPSSTFTRAFFQ
jgi:hypothetical protein